MLVSKRIFDCFFSYGLSELSGQRVQKDSLRAPAIGRAFGATVLAWLVICSAALAASQGDPLLPADNERHTRYEREYPAIAYGTVRPSGRIAALQAKIDRGDQSIEFDASSGYLAGVLRALNIDPSSQLLVFSRTSVNVTHIRADRPRAIYFNDEVYVGWVPGSGMLEVASMDPQLGPVFYIFEQQQSAEPQFDRQTVQCLRCHDSLTMTGGGVPRFILGSGYVDAGGNLVSHEGWILTSPETPFRFRWGGWYVTGSHGDQRHLGNIVVEDPTTLRDLDSLRVFNVDDVDDLIDTERYLTSHSDIVALLVIEHQVHVQNLITRTNYDVRSALANERLQQKGIGNTRNEYDVPKQMKALVEASAEPLVKAMLFLGEAELTSPVAGSTDFATQFEKAGPFDSEGRSLRQLDLRHRTFRYPLSYLVYSEAFDRLPTIVRNYIYRRFDEILSGSDKDVALDRWNVEERSAALEILRATKPAFAAIEGSATAGVNRNE